MDNIKANQDVIRPQDLMSQNITKTLLNQLQPNIEDGLESSLRENDKFNQNENFLNRKREADPSLSKEIRKLQEVSAEGKLL